MAPLWLCIPLLATLIAPAQADLNPSTRSLLFDGLFTVEATITVIDKDSKERVVAVSEIYSKELGRARIEVTPLEGHLMHDGNIYTRSDDLILKLANSNHKCEVIKSDELIVDLFGRLVFLGSDWLAERPDVSSNIIGISRLLNIVDSDKASLEKTEDTTATAHNHKATPYIYRLKVGDGKSFCKAYFAAYDFKFNAAELPIRIWCLLPDNSLIIVDYKSIRPAASLGLLDELTKTDSLQTLIYPLGFNCSSTIRNFLGPRAAGSRLNRQGSEWPKTVSFRAAMVDLRYADHGKLVRTQKIFTAYDEELRAARLDEFNTTYYGSSIHDIKNGYNYHIGQPLDLERDSSGSSCVAVRSKWPSGDKVMQPIINFDQLVEMGFGRTRNIKVRVYEQVVGDKLPTLFFPQVDYLDISGQHKEAEFPLMSNQIRKVLSGINRPLTVVYMIAERDDSVSDEVGPLVELQVVAAGRTIFKIDIEQFSWSLERAPNGDAPGELFSLEQKCCQLPGACGPKRRARLEALLEFVPFSATAPDLGQAEAELILQRSPVVRDENLVRGLVAGSPLSTGQVGSIHSRLHLEAGRLLVEMSAHLTSPTVPAFEAKFAGYTTSWKYDVTSYDVFSLHECYSQAALRRATMSNTQHLLFTFCDEKCLFDENARPAAAGNWSSSLNLSWNHFDLCPAFEMSPADPLEPDKAVEDWQGAYSSLNDKLLFVPYDESEEARMILRFMHLDIKSDRWLASQGSRDSGAERIVLRGVGLRSLADGGAGQPIGQLESGAMNEARCYAACLARMDCNSYSLCKTRSGVECMTSSLALGGQPDLLRAIEAARSRSRPGAQELLVNYRSALSGETNSDNRTLKFDLHLRCQLVERQPMEMFTFDRSVQLKVSSASRFKKVDDVQKCASLCLSRSLSYIRRKARQDTLNKAGLSRGWCQGFKYVDLSTVRLSNLFVALSGLQDPSTGGLCILEYPDWEADQRKQVTIDTDYSADLELDSFRFLYINLYERQLGSRLSGLLSTDEAKPRNNQSVLAASSADQCAKACFSQLVEVQPSCRSFDMITLSARSLPGPDRPQAQPRSYCVYNSLTSADIRAMARAGLIESDQAIVEERVSEYATAIHYEPFEALKFQPEPARVVSPTDEADEPVDSAPVEPGALTLTLSLALLSGLGLAVLMYRRVERHLTSRDETEIAHRRLEQDLDILSY